MEIPNPSSAGSPCGCQLSDTQPSPTLESQITESNLASSLVHCRPGESLPWLCLIPLTGPALQVRLQVQSTEKPQYRGTLHCFQSIVKQESVSACMGQLYVWGASPEVLEAQNRILGHL